MIRENDLNSPLESIELLQMLIVSKWASVKVALGANPNLSG